jgi:hypothetical protein
MRTAGLNYAPLAGFARASECAFDYVFVPDHVEKF